MEQKMYGSTHTHFEDMRDTANNLESMVLNFANQGAKRIALTGHGNMFALEDLKSIVKNLKKEGKIDEDFELVPGVEVYFGDESKHMVLVAKNYEGYLDLCKVITDSSSNTKMVKSGEEGNSDKAKDNEYPTPLVTLENLKKNIRKGNVYATSACVGGVFCVDLGLKESKLIEKFDKETARKKNEYAKKLSMFTEEGLERAKRNIEAYTKNDKNIEYKAPTKTEKEKAFKIVNDERVAVYQQALIDNPDDEKTRAKLEKLLEKQKEANKEIDSFTIREQKAQEYKNWKLEHKPEADIAKAYIKNYNKLLKESEEEPEVVAKARVALEEYRATEEERWSQAKALYSEFEEIFGKDDFYFELQNHGLPFEKIGFNNMVRLAYEVGNPNFIASNDVHIGDIKGSDTWEDSLFRRDIERFLRYKTEMPDNGDREEYGIKNDAELREAVLDIIEPYRDADGVLHSSEEIVDSAIANIRGALEPCKVVFPEISINGLNHYPKFCDDENKMFKEKVEEGLKRRFPDGLPEGYRERVDYEMDIVLRMGYAGYHLIVQDYLEYGRLLGYLRGPKEVNDAPLTIEELNKYIDDNNIPRIGMGLGPGRGSAAGSLCCFALGITDIDPIKNGLLFERFLNPDRQSMPDIDSDFIDYNKDKMYEYIKTKYGSDCVSRIVTKSYAYGKESLGIAERYYLTKKEAEIKKKYSTVSSVTDKMLNTKQRDAELKETKTAYLTALSNLSKLVTNRIDADDDLESTKVKDGTKAISRLYAEGAYSNDIEKQIMETAIKIAGIPNTLSIHPCGAIISKDPLKDIIPMAWNSENGVMTTQCLYPQAEELGMLKMDVLLLKNLSIITSIMQETGDTRLMDLKEREKIFSDPSLYSEIYGKGRTKGCFQVESPGMTQMMVNFQPECFEDIVILVAAYRPGPLAFIPEIIANKWWNKFKDDPSRESKYADKIREIYPFSQVDYEDAKANNRAYMYDADGNVLMPPPQTISIKNEKLQKILEPTYGAPMYQEQVMEIFKQLAGYTPGEADMVRKYMGKKKTEALAKEKPIFVKNCMEREGISEDEANMLFDKLAEFGKYAFNKSHAACYAQVSVFTAYQKKEFPREFYKYSIANEIKGAKQKNEDSVVVKYMKEMTDAGIKILPPAIGKSSDDIISEGSDSLRLGYGNIKGESYGVTYRAAKSIQEFIMKNPTVSLKSVETFVSLGMFDACWSIKDGYSNEVRRVNGNRNSMQKWVEKYGDKCKSYGNILLKEKELGAENSRLDQIIKEGSEDKAILAGFESLKNVENKYLENDQTLKNYADEKLGIKKFLEKWKNMEYEEGYRPAEQPDEIKKNMAIETDKLGFPFSTSSSLEKLKADCGDKCPGFYGNKTSRISVPASIVSVQEKMGKKSGKPYYLVTAIDTKGDLLTMMSFNKMDTERLSGVFVIDIKPSDKYGDSYFLQRIDKTQKEIELERSGQVVVADIAGTTSVIINSNAKKEEEVKAETPLSVLEELSKEISVEKEDEFEDSEIPEEEDERI